MSTSLDDLVRASGLSPLFARSAIQRAVTRCGVQLDRLSSEDAERLVGDLRRVIEIFDPQNVDLAARRIRDVLVGR